MVKIMDFAKWIFGESNYDDMVENFILYHLFSCQHPPLTKVLKYMSDVIISRRGGGGGGGWMNNSQFTLQEGESISINIGTGGYHGYGGILLEVLVGLLNLDFI